MVIRDRYNIIGMAMREMHEKVLKKSIEDSCRRHVSRLPRYSSFLSNPLEGTWFHLRNVAIVKGNAHRFRQKLTLFIVENMQSIDCKYKLQCTHFSEQRVTFSSLLQHVPCSLLGALFESQKYQLSQFSSVIFNLKESLLLLFALQLSSLNKSVHFSFPVNIKNHCLSGYHD